VYGKLYLKVASACVDDKRSSASFVIVIKQFFFCLSILFIIVCNKIQIAQDQEIKHYYSFKENTCMLHSSHFVSSHTSQCRQAVPIHTRCVFNIMCAMNFRRHVASFSNPPSAFIPFSIYVFCTGVSAVLTLRNVVLNAW